MAQTIPEFAFSAIVDVSQDGVFVLNAERRFVLFNKACERLTGFTASEVLGTGCRCSDLTHCQDEQGRSLAGLLCPGLAVFRGDADSARQRMRITTRSGEPRWVETQYTTIRDGDGRALCILGVVRDNSDAHEREGEWRQTIEELRTEVERLRGQLCERYGFGTLITRSPRMQTVLEKIDAASSNSSPVIISGEPGTGKEMLARLIHEHSPRQDRPFVSTTALTMPRDRAEGELFGYVQGSFAGAGQDYDGLFIAAEGGTLLLEDVDALASSTQLRLLRVLQDKRVTPVGSLNPRPISARLITTTRRPPSELVAAGTLRQDLYYRLGVITIEVPPLRARREDIPLLVKDMVDGLNQTNAHPISEIDPAVWSTLDAYDWPGNVRELCGVIEAAAAAAREGRIRAEDIVFRRPTTASAVLGPTDTLPLDDQLADIERRTILAALKRAGGQRNLAAKLMGISRSRLYRRMEALGINPDEEQG